MKAFYRYMTRVGRHHKLPRLQGRFKNPLPQELGDDAALVLLAGIARDDFEADRLLTDAQASAPEFLKHLPKRRIDYVRRLKSWIRSLEGSYESDPHREEYLEAKRVYKWERGR